MNLIQVAFMLDRHAGRTSNAHGSKASLLSAVLTSLACSTMFAADRPPRIAPDHAERMARGQALFVKQVRGILTERCYRCHGGEKRHGELELTTRETLLAGGTKGPAIVAGDAAASRLYRLITHQDEPHMPHKEARLSDEQLNCIADWINLGAPYDRPLAEQADRPAHVPMQVTDRDREFWGFQPLGRFEPPHVKRTDWCRTAIDYFILHRQEKQGLAPNSSVDRRRLIRRAYFDLLGLPPTPEEIDRFLADDSANAYERLLDRLLESPHFGERWARHWLDLARFAESHGYEQDYNRPNAYHYRDFVIRAFNQDLPYDKFVQWQIAGDEFDPENPLAMMATGFLAAGTHATQITANQAEKERYDELDDMVRTIGTTMLGLTIGCARCHDHKYDPIPNSDYYRLVSTFSTTVRSDLDVNVEPESYKVAKADYERDHAPLV